MKTRLNITIENSILMQAKDYAASKQLSISQMVEDYLKVVIKPSQKKNILDLVDELEVPENLTPEADLKKLFYEEQSEKYGF